MNQSVLGHYTPKEKESLNPFDRSFFMRFNFSGGMQLPVFCQPVIGGSKVELDMSSFIRAAKVNTAAFDQVKYCVDFFQVPLTQICTSWYQNMKTRVLDVHSTTAARPVTDEQGNISQTLATLLPKMDNQFLMASVLSDWSGDFYFANPDGAGNTAAVDDGGYPMTTGAIRLFDLLNLPRLGVDVTLAVAPDPSETHVHISEAFTDQQCLINYNPLKLCAYQKVYYDHYRNSQYERNNPFAYNIDKAMYEGTDIGKYQASKMCEIHYVNYYKNFYTNIYPSLNINAYAGDGNSAPKGFELPDDLLGLVPFSGVLRTAGIITHDSITGGSAVAATLINSSTTATNFSSVQQIRAAFALDRLSRMQAYNPQHVNPQLKARFGFTSDSIAKQESKYLGSFDTDIVFGEVTATATTGTGSDSSTLGEIGGKGIGARRKGKMLRFDVNDDSIIIGIGYAIPRMAVDSYGLDEWSLKLEPREFFTKEYENLGLQNLSFYQLLGMSVGQEEEAEERGISNNSILGYQPRYSEYKIGIDRNHGLFKFGGALSPFVTHQFAKFLRTDTDFPFSYFANHGVDHRFFKVTPADLDPLFAESYIGMEETDQFFGQLDFTFKVLQNMSVHGEPASIMV